MLTGLTSITQWIDTSSPRSQSRTRFGKHANESNRLIAAYVQGSHLSDIKKVHCFTNRPIWPQGFELPEGKDEISESLDWQNWLDCADGRPFLGKRVLEPNWPPAATSTSVPSARY